LSASADGRVIIAIAQDLFTPFKKSIYTSPDFGATWQQVNPGNGMPLNGWGTVFVTASGAKLIAVNENGQSWNFQANGIKGGAFDSVTLQFNKLDGVDCTTDPSLRLCTWSIVNMTGNGLKNY